MHYVDKTYGHEAGLSACFRQHRATSHCRFLHGYALSFKFTFRATELDERGWVINFGGLKPIKQWLEDTFDHKLLIAEDDPALNELYGLGDNDLMNGKLAQTVVVPAVGCEAFASMAWDFVEQFLNAPEYHGRVFLDEVEVREHRANGVKLRKD